MEIGANISESISERPTVNYQVGFRLHLNKRLVCLFHLEAGLKKMRSQLVA